VSSVSRSRIELQGRLDALEATLHQMRKDRIHEDLLWEAVELFVDLPSSAFESMDDRVWWDAKVLGALATYGLIGRDKERPPSAPRA
jgi:hypothetical protein